MNCCGETAKMGVPPGNRRVLVPRRTSTVRRRGQHPRTPGRTGISVVAAGVLWNILARYLLPPASGLPNYTGGEKRFAHGLPVVPGTQGSARNSKLWAVSAVDWGPEGYYPSTRPPCIAGSQPIPLLLDSRTLPFNHPSMLPKGG